MIKNNKTIDGIKISLLKNKSKKRIIRVCDLCDKEDNIAYKDYVCQKERKNKKKY